MWGEPSWTFSPRQAEQRQEVWYIPNDITWASGFSHAWRQSVQLDAAECSSWNSDTLATWCKELTHWKRTWCRERLKVGGEGDDRGWNGWMASPMRWTWVWVGSRSWWWTGKPVVLRSMGSCDWATEMNWPSHYRILSKSDLYGKQITLQVKHRLPQNTSIHREMLKDPPPLSENYRDI